MSKKPFIAIIDSGGANIASILFALERLGADATLTTCPKIINEADRVILPGVGSATAAMARLNHFHLISCIQQLEQPVLGICLGMQLLFSHSEEGDVTMLECISDDIHRFPSHDDLTIPHMGWNQIQHTADHPLLYQVPQLSHMYFIHSYFAPIGEHTISQCDYGAPFTAIAAKKNFLGCQFHPERSSKAGAQLLKNFLEIPQ